jgi:hypothetical protein
MAFHVSEMPRFVHATQSQRRPIRAEVDVKHPQRLIHQDLDLFERLCVVEDDATIVRLQRPSQRGLSRVTDSPPHASLKP